MKNSEIGNRVKQYPDGKYRWIYEKSMLRDPSILFTVYKVLGFSLMIVWLFVVIITFIETGFDLEDLGSLTLGFLAIAGFLMLLGLIVYLIVAWTYDWKYVVLFTLDEKEVKHEQIPRQARKAVKLGELTAFVGLLAGKPTTIGAGLLAASHTTSTSVLKNVEKLIPCRKKNTIKVNQLLSKNRVYVTDEDFDFVYDFLCKHCVKAKKK